MARHASEADRLRAHRAAFNLALELGVTPREAEAVLAQRAARDRWQVAKAKLDARRGGTVSQITVGPAVEQSPGPKPWMLAE